MTSLLNTLKWLYLIDQIGLWGAKTFISSRTRCSCWNGGVTHQIQVSITYLCHPLLYWDQRTSHHLPQLGLLHWAHGLPLEGQVWGWCAKNIARQCHSIGSFASRNRCSFYVPKYESLKIAPTRQGCHDWKVLKMINLEQDKFDDFDFDAFNFDNFNDCYFIDSDYFEFKDFVWQWQDKYTYYPFQIFDVPPEILHISAQRTLLPTCDYWNDCRLPWQDSRRDCLGHHF